MHVALAYENEFDKKSKTKYCNRVVMNANEKTHP